MNNVTQVDKICFTNFVDLTRLAHLPWLILQPSVASTMITYESSLQPLASSMENIHHVSTSWIFAKNSLTRTYTFDWSQLPLINMVETYATTYCCLEPFRWESLWRWDLGHNLLSQAFSVGIPLMVGFRPQLVVVSGLSVGIPSTVGFRPLRSLWLSQSPFTYSSSFTMDF
jgi:hypothetical protein